MYVIKSNLLFAINLDIILLISLAIARRKFDFDREKVASAITK